MMRPCARPASYVVRGLDGLEWFVCDRHGAHPAPRWIVRTEFAEWFQARGLDVPAPGTRVCNEPINVDAQPN